jgi:lipoate---protein ligase
MQFWDISFSNPSENIVFDEVLLDSAAQGEGEEILRFWESPKIFIVLGRTGQPEKELILDQVRADQVPVVRRSSGGGTVVQGPGCLNFSWILPKTKNPSLADIRQSYRYILTSVITALKTCGVAAEFRPISDLVVLPNELKFSGNAQRRVRNHLLHHGTILYDFDLALIERYLALPTDCPSYRRSRPHRDFVTNVPLQPADFKKAFCSLVGAGEPLVYLDEKMQEKMAVFLNKRTVLIEKASK